MRVRLSALPRWFVLLVVPVLAIGFGLLTHFTEPKRRRKGAEE